MWLQATCGAGQDFCFGTPNFKTFLVKKKKSSHNYSFKDILDFILLFFGIHICLLFHRYLLKKKMSH